jgi:hypothetical protein
MYQSKTQSKNYQLIKEALKLANTIPFNDSKIDITLSGFSCLKEATPDSLAETILSRDDSIQVDMSY